MTTRGESGVAEMRAAREDTGVLLRPRACQGMQCQYVPHRQSLQCGFVYESVWFTSGGAKAKESCPL